MPTKYLGLILYQNDFLPLLQFPSDIINSPFVKYFMYSFILLHIVSFKFLFNDISKSCTIVKLKDILLGSVSIPITEYKVQSKNITYNKNKGYYIEPFIDSSDKYQVEKIKNKEARHIPKNMVETKNDLPYDAENNEYRYVIDEDSYYEYVLNEWLIAKETGEKGSWQFYSFNVNMPINADATLKLPTKCSALTKAALYKDSWKTPYHDNSYYHATLTNLGYGGPIYYPEKLTDNGFNSIRLFFYRGCFLKVNPPYIDKKLPIATVTDKNIFGSKIATANLSLDYTSENSILNRCGKEWAEWLAFWRKDIQETIIWPEHIFNNFDFTVKYEIESNLYLVNSIDFEVEANETIKWGVTELARV